MGVRSKTISYIVGAFNKKKRKKKRAKSKKRGGR